MDRRIERNVLEDMKKIGRGNAPEPQVDWDLVWVFSGPGIDISEDFSCLAKTVFFDHQDVAAVKDVTRRINESRERLLTGLTIAWQVAAKRLKKSVETLSLEDVCDAAPDVYWNGTDWQNENLRARITREGFLIHCHFPIERMIVSPNLGIRHTGDQFTELEDWVVWQRRKIVLVSDTYHLPRIKRYLRNRGCKIDPASVVLYPSSPRRVLVAKALQEIRKIPSFIERGILQAE